jgi:hypothetical protein
MPIIPELWRLRQENCKFEISLSYIARPCLKEQNKYPCKYLSRPLGYPKISTSVNFHRDSVRLSMMITHFTEEETEAQRGRCR